MGFHVRFELRGEGRFPVLLMRLGTTTSHGLRLWPWYLSCCTLICTGTLYPTGNSWATSKTTPRNAAGRAEAKNAGNKKAHKAFNLMSLQGYGAEGSNF